ncbi:lipoate--protein ligase family protein [Vibrio mexicanus]|uniref:lipoate--protein ligase family protein n=1 Tax=Vibrio mexicanus TaxID=1004326 RepID=UPI00063C2E3F|nr:lipoate--protein ligase family protein [Vibrio mexicanus]
MPHAKNHATEKAATETSKTKAKILRYESVNVENVFNTEGDILKAIQSSQLDQALILWQTNEDTLVLPAGSKWQQSDELAFKLKEMGWQLYARKTGGAPVPQTQGVINVSYMYAIEDDHDYSISNAYESFCDILSAFFKYFDVKVDVHDTPGSYCDGKYNLNINGRKVVGTAQRVVLKKGGGKVVLAQACILIGTQADVLVEPVNLCYEHHQQNDRAQAKVHTNLFDHISDRPTIEELYRVLLTCFIDAQK